MELQIITIGGYGNSIANEGTPAKEESCTRFPTFMLQTKLVPYTSFLILLI